MRKVFYYKHNGFVPVEDFINKSDEKVKKKFLFCVGYILGEPGVLSEPYVIVTVYNSDNCGSFLQAYALKCICERGYRRSCLSYNVC